MVDMVDKAGIMIPSTHHMDMVTAVTDMTATQMRIRPNRHRFCQCEVLKLAAK
jgi:hypothetical protein